MFGGVIYNHYLCIDNVREMSGWGNNTSWSVDSNLLYKIYKGSPMLSEGNERDTLVPLKYNVYLCGMITILYLISPLIIWSVAKVLSEMYNRVETFLFDED